MGRAKAIYIEEKYCTGCQLCVEFCPKKVLGVSKELNQKGVYVPYVAELDACTACGICELYCGAFAIAVEQKEKEAVRG